jgi:peptidoglycan lytic transglycosylase
MKVLILGGAIAAAMALTARTEARPPELKWLQAPKVLPFKVQTGVASWYGRECQGKYTASGEPFDMNGLTCASRTLPLGSRIRITNLRNLRSLVLRVNDRGPAIGSRLVDVSMAAARRLGFVGAGLTPVELQVVRFPKGWPLEHQVPPILPETLN